MNNGNKKIIFILLALLILGGVVYWFFFFNKTSTPIDQKPGGLPFGQGGNTVTLPSTTGNSNESTSTTPTTLVDMFAPGLYLISKDPIGGIASFDVSNVGHVRYVDRTTGNIFESVRGSSELIRLTNTTIPKVYEALWSSDGREVIMRYLKEDNETIRSFYAKLSASSTRDQEISGLFLNDNIRAVGTAGNKILWVKKQDPNFSIILSNFDGTKPVSVFSSPLANWQIASSVTNTGTIYSSPSGIMPGVVYSISLTNGSYTKVFEANGAEGVGSSDGKKTLVSGYVNGKLITKIVSGGNMNGGVALALSTLAEKCVWGDLNTVYCAVPKNIPDAVYPDSWYTGEVSFNDSLWKINTDTGEAVVVADLSSLARQPIDAIELTINRSGNAIAFKNKQNLSGWVYILR
jgi:hypothetical protein